MVLQGGQQTYGVRDLTGAAPSSMTTAAVQELGLISKLKLAAAAGVTTMVGVSCFRKDVGQEGDIGNGILAGHQYTLVDFIDEQPGQGQG